MINFIKGVQIIFKNIYVIYVSYRFDWPPKLYVTIPLCKFYLCNYIVYGISSVWSMNKWNIISKVFICNITKYGMSDMRCKYGIWGWGWLRSRKWRRWCSGGAILGFEVYFIPLRWKIIILFFVWLKIIFFYLYIADIELYLTCSCANFLRFWISFSENSGCWIDWMDREGTMNLKCH